MGININLTELQVDAVPEPSSLFVLIGTAFVLCRRRRKE